MNFIDTWRLELRKEHQEKNIEELIGLNNYHIDQLLVENGIAIGYFFSEGYPRKEKMIKDNYFLLEKFMNHPNEVIRTAIASIGYGWEQLYKDTLSVRLAIIQTANINSPAHRITLDKLLLSPQLTEEEVRYVFSKGYLPKHAFSHEEIWVRRLAVIYAEQTRYYAILKQLAMTETAEEVREILKEKGFLSN